MTLINRYIQEVTRSLPEKTREDITLELESTILDMLPENYSEEDVHHALEDLGDPIILAAGYRDRPMHIIGPTLYGAYIDILKLVTPIVGIVVFISFLIEKMHTNNSNQSIFILFVESLGTLFEAGIHVFFWVTIIFIIIERLDTSQDAITKSSKKKRWTPADLKKLPIPARRTIKVYEPSFNLFWTVLWLTLYFNADQIIGIYNGTQGLTFVMPIFNQETLLSYVIVVLIFLIVEIMKYLYMLIVREWTMKLAIGNTLNHLFGGIVLLFILLDPNLFHAELASYLVNVTGASTTYVVQGITWITWTVFTIAFITGTLDSITGFKKARSK